MIATPQVIGSSPKSDRLAWVAAALALIAAVLFAYGGALANGFLEYDDPFLLDRVRNGLPPTPRFRPLYQFWNGLLYAAFGLTAWPYYLAGLALHALNSFCCLLLVQRLSGSLRAGVVAGLVFALLYSPHEALLWIAANCGVLAVTFILLGAVAWLSYLRTRSRGAYALALLATIGAMGSKEDAVLLGPLLIGLDVFENGARSLARPRAWKRYVPFIVLAAIYVAIAYRPETWRGSTSVGNYGFGSALLPKLLGNFGLIFGIGRKQPLATSDVAVTWGVIAIGALALAAVWSRYGGRTIALGLVVAICALLPVLPGPFNIAGMRYSYPAAIGIALMAGGVAFEILSRTRSGAVALSVRALVVAATAVWIVVSVTAIRAVEVSRFERHSARFANVIESTRQAVLAAQREHDPALNVAVIAPAVWNTQDYKSALTLYLSDVATFDSVEWVPLDADFASHLAPNGRLDPAVIPVYASDDDGRFRRIDPKEPHVPAAWLRRQRFAWQHEGSVPVVWLKPVHTRRSGV